MTTKRNKRRSAKSMHKTLGKASSAVRESGVDSCRHRHLSGIDNASDNGSIRLQKVLSDLGFGSRRKIESWITAGRVHVDGKVAKLGEKVTFDSHILLDGKTVKHRVSTLREVRIIAYNKPEGEICSRDDPGNRPTVFRRLPRLQDARWVAVGRLDINTRGLLLFTDHGELANCLMHPNTGLEREYLCRVFGNVDDNTLARLRKEVTLDGLPVGFRSVSKYRGTGANAWFRVVVTEGRYREVRRLWAAVGCQVNRLVRVRYGPVTLKRGLLPGRWVELSRAEVNEIVKLSQATKTTRPLAEGH